MSEKRVTLWEVFSASPGFQCRAIRVLPSQVAVIGDVDVTQQEEEDPSRSYIVVQSRLYYLQETPDEVEQVLNNV